MYFHVFKFQSLSVLEKYEKLEIGFVIFVYTSEFPTSVLCLNFFQGCSALVFKLLIDILEGAILFPFLISKHVSNLSGTDLVK